MKRIIVALALAAVAAFALSAGAEAPRHASKSQAKSATVVAAPAAAVPAASVAKGASCPIGGCTHRSGAGSARATAGASFITTSYSMNGQACPVSDPSKCPASCPRTSATAVAANTPSR